MFQINLLPWREQTRKLNKIRFFIWMGMFIGFSLFLLLILHLWYNRLFDRQQALNDYLRSEINQEQATLSNLVTQQINKSGLESKLNFIIDLQKKNFLVIRFFNELKSLIPNNITLSSIVKNSNKITLVGTAQSDADLANFKQRITTSPIFEQPILKEVSAEKEVTTINFVLEVIQKDIL